MSSRRTRSVLVALGCLTAVGVLAGCGGDDSDAAGGGELRLVTTVAPITSIVASVAGERATIDGIVPEGTNSHTFEPPPSAAKVLSQADVVFINGLKLEDPTKELAEQNMRDGARLVEIGTDVLPESEYIYDFSFPKSEGKPNPHLWTDPLLAVKYAEVVRDTLIAVAPDDADYFTANAEKFIAQANELSDALKTASATVPKRELLTYHDAYAYFARDYGWNVIGAVQPKDFEDPTPKEVAALIAQVKRQRVPTIFGSEVFPSTVLEQIGRETGARYEDTLRDDDLPGKPGDAEHSWFGLMRYDYVTMVRGLGGDPSALEALDGSGLAPDKAHYPQ